MPFVDMIHLDTRWQNDVLRLWHGTDESQVHSLLAGIRLPPAQRLGGWDFGRGFYVTDARTASLWATIVSRRRGRTAGPRLDPALIEITTPPLATTGLSIIAFAGAEREFSWLDSYWQYVQYCRAATASNRTGGAPPAGQDPYDLAVGPIARLILGALPTLGNQPIWQICFKTPAAVDVLNSGAATRRQVALP